MNNLAFNLNYSKEQVQRALELGELQTRGLLKDIFGDIHKLKGLEASSFKEDLLIIRSVTPLAKTTMLVSVEFQDITIITHYYNNGKYTEVKEHEIIDLTTSAVLDRIGAIHDMHRVMSMK